MFVTPGSRASRKRISVVTSTVAGSTAAAVLGPFTTNDLIYANSSNTITTIPQVAWDGTALMFNQLTRIGSNTSNNTTGYLHIASSNITSSAVSGSNQAGLEVFAYDSGSGGTNVNTNLNMTNYNNDGYGDAFALHYSRGAASSAAIVQSSDTLAFVSFFGGLGAGNGFAKAVDIRPAVDAAPSSASMPGRLSLFTTPTGSITPVERMRINNQGLAYIGNLTGGTFGSGGALNIGVNTSALDAVNFLAYDAATGFGPNVNLAYTRGTVPSSNVIVQSSDGLGFINFNGANGVASFRRGAGISAVVEPTPSAAFVPARLAFATTSSGGVYTERMRIDSAGNIAMGNNGAETTAGGFPLGLSVAHDLGTFWGSAFCGYGNNNFNYAMWIRKTKGTVPSSHVIVGANSELFVMSYQGSNGASFQEAASIDVWVDGTPLSSAAPGGPSMPGRIDFVTNPGPTGSLVRLSIDSVGNTWLRTAGQPGVTPPGTTGSVNGTVSCYNHQVYGGI